MKTEPVTARIQVVQVPPSRLIIIGSQILFWTVLTAAIGVSRIWFGGSFLLEVMICGFCLAALVYAARKSTGVDVTMTPTELRAWLFAGAPANVQSWRKMQAPSQQDNSYGN